MKRLIFFTILFKITGLLSLLWLIVYSIIFNSWIWLVISFIYYKIIVGFIGNQISQHRYISHKSFTTTNSKNKFLAWISITTGIDPILYASIHRHHHIHSDSLKDPHSPKNSLWGSLVSWSSSNLPKIKPAVDLFRNRDIFLVHRIGLTVLLLITILAALLNWKIAVFIILAGIGWNYLHMNVIRTTLVHCKIFGSYRNFHIDDNSWNNKIIQVLDIGEGLHNNHHKYPHRYNQAVLPNEFDPAGFVVDKFFAINK